MYKMNDDDLKKLCREVKRRSGSDRLVMSFSCGSDAVAMFLRILETGEYDMSKGVYYYYYYTPNISWVQEYIEYFEKKYNITIHQLPGEIYMRDLYDYNYIDPMMSIALDEMNRRDEGFVPYSKDHIKELVCDWEGLNYAKTFHAVGIKQGDSPIRRKQMRDNRGISGASLSWYPIWDYEVSDVPKIIKRHGELLPYCYELFGISFENIDYRFLKVIKENCPENYKRIKERFPLIDINIERVEYYKPEWGVKRGTYYKKMDVLKPVGAL